jgi:CBS domain-containing protein
MLTVRELLERKGYDIWSISPDASVHDAVQVLDEKNVGALMVVDEDMELIGLVSERDVARKIVLREEPTKHTPVRQIMTQDVLYVTPDESIEECMAIMTDKHIRHLPVLEDDKLIGVISIGDVVKSVIGEKEFMIEQLEHYIQGRR